MHERVAGFSEQPEVREAAPRVAILHDDVVQAARLRQVLDGLRCPIVDVFPNVSLEELQGLRRDTALIALPLHPARPETLARAKRLAMEPGKGARILALARPEDVVHSLETLRDSGIAGLLATDASVSQIEFRLNGLLDLFAERRQQLRVRVLLPVEVGTSDGSSRECCVSLSGAGMGIACRRPLEPNSEIELGLCVSAAEPTLSLRGRVIHCFQEATSVPPFRVGVYFLRLSPHATHRLEAIIAAAD